MVTKRLKGFFGNIVCDAPSSMGTSSKPAAGISALVLVALTAITAPLPHHAAPVLTLRHRTTFESKLSGVAHGDAGFVIVSVGSSEVYSSADGMDWTPKPTGPSDGFHTVDFAGGLYIATSPGNIFESSDGTSWEHAYEETSQASAFREAAYCSGAWVAVGGGGVILRRGMGESWTRIDSPTTKDLHTVTCVGNHLYAGGDAYTIIRSEDAGLNWQVLREESLGAPDNLRVLKHDGRRFLAISYYNDLRTATRFSEIHEGADVLAMRRHSFGRMLFAHDLEISERVFFAVGDGNLFAPQGYLGASLDGWEWDIASWPSDLWSQPSHRNLEKKLERTV